jgi:GT2 family glycosyltransferase
MTDAILHWLSQYPPSSPVLIIPVFNALEDVNECLDSLLSHTAKNVPILVIDDASTDPTLQPALENRAQREGFGYYRKPDNEGFVGSCNTGFELAHGRDVVIINSDVMVPAGWLERLQSAAYYRTNIATATPLTNHGSIVSVPNMDRPSNQLPNNLSLEHVDARIRQHSLLLRPIIPTAIGHLTYVKRAALDTVGVFDKALAPGYGEEVDFSQRAGMAGFCHVVADDLFVYHKGSRSFGANNDNEKERKRRAIQDQHERLINHRYPWYETWRGMIANEPDSPYTRAIARARASLVGYRIAIDATCVNQFTTGTQVLTLELLNALMTMLRNRAEADIQYHLTAIVADGELPESLKALVAQAHHQLTIRPISEFRKKAHSTTHAPPSFDVVYRPFQLTSSRDLKFLLTIGRRFIISQLDCIAYANPSYALSPQAWVTYRKLTEHVFAYADGITYISADAQHDAQHRGLLMPPERECVTYVGVDHQLHLAVNDALRLPNDLSATPFILALGTNFKHKNRVYAINALKLLIEKYAWQGKLVFAGPNVASGGSVNEEADVISASTTLKDRVVYIGAVDEAQKKLLLKHAALVLYPSTYEGFGLIPFEAAYAGVPCLAMRTTSVLEVLGDKAQYLPNYNPSDGAALIWRMISEPASAQTQITAILERAVKFNWFTVAQKTLAFIDQILCLPSRRSGDTIAPINFSDDEDVVVSAKSWAQRARKAIRTLRAEGSAGLRREVDQYLRWKRGQL